MQRVAALWDGRGDGPQITPCHLRNQRTLTQISAWATFWPFICCFIRPHLVFPASGGRSWYTAVAAQLNGSHATAR